MPVLTIVFWAFKLLWAFPFINAFASGSTFSVTFYSGTGAHLLFRRLLGVEDVGKELELFALVRRKKKSEIYDPANRRNRKKA